MMRFVNERALAGRGDTETRRRGEKTRDAALTILFSPRHRVSVSGFAAPRLSSFLDSLRGASLSSWLNSAARRGNPLHFQRR
jgi:hypothetical protein